MRPVAPNIRECATIVRQRRFFAQERAQTIFGDRKNFRSEKCSLGVYVGFESLIVIARSVFTILRAAQMQVAFVFGEKLLNGVILSQNSKQLMRGVELSFEPAHLGKRRIELGARRNFVRTRFA